MINTNLRYFLMGVCVDYLGIFYHSLPICVYYDLFGTYLLPPYLPTSSLPTYSLPTYLQELYA